MRPNNIGAKKTYRISFKFRPKRQNFLDMSKLKAFPDDNISDAQILDFVFDLVENIVGKGENAGYQHFSFPHNVFLRHFTLGRGNSEMCRTSRKISDCIPFIDKSRLRGNL